MEKLGVMTHLLTSGFILLWLAGFSLLWAEVALRWRQPPHEGAVDSFLPLPVMLFAPMVIYLAQNYFHIPVIYPVVMTSSVMQLLIFAILPGLLLLYGSGLAHALRSTLYLERSYWSQQDFNRTAQSIGLPQARRLPFLIRLRSLAMAYERCLPWLFGELILLECLLNAPGLGLQIWRLARQQEFTGLWLAMSQLLILYVALYLMIYLVKQWIGEKLDGYA